MRHTEEPTEANDGLPWRMGDPKPWAILEAGKINRCEGCGEQTCDADECLGVREPNRAGTAHAIAEHQP